VTDLGFIVAAYAITGLAIGGYVARIALRTRRAESAEDEG
jgi:CcmD family protein